MLEQIQNKLKAAINFPSPPAVAQQIIALAGDPNVDVAHVAATIGKDPGLAAKVLRVANSPLYAKHRKCENLRQALIILGLNGATTLALSFSLVNTYRGIRVTGIDYARFWRRTILCASAARVFAAQQPGGKPDDVFLAALLQEIAVLAIDRVDSSFYVNLPIHATHAELIAHETARLGTDHAGLGAWLLAHWKLPESLCRTVAVSHTPHLEDAASAVGRAARCVALGMECAELLMARRAPTTLDALALRAEQWLELSSEQLAESMSRIVAEVPEVEHLFDTTLLSDDAAVILDQARELLMIRNLQAFEQVNSLRATTEHLEARTVELQDQHRRDALTGVFNRGYLDQILGTEFQAALTGHWPMSVVFTDLDRFKLVNDTYGHAAGDIVLSETANLIRSVARSGDYIARYGGEEFVIVLPGLPADGAAIFCERLLERLRTSRHPVGGTSLTVTASLGLATHTSERPFRSAAELLEAADRAVYASKRAGRNQLTIYDARLLARAG